jgi:hypothetical protein
MKLGNWFRISKPPPQIKYASNELITYQEKEFYDPCAYIKEAHFEHMCKSPRQRFIIIEKRICQFE